MKPDGPSQMTFLPRQLRRLTLTAYETGGAIGVTQDGSVLTVDTGKTRFRIDASGNIIQPNPDQETLC